MRAQWPRRFETPAEKDERQRIVLDALDAVDGYASGDWTPADLLALSDPAELIEGLILTVQLGITIEQMRGVDPADTVKAMRDSARWRK